MKIEKKYLLIGAAVLVICGGVYCFIPKNNNDKIETQKIDTCTITQIVEASGTINPVNTVSVGSTVSGLIKEIYVDFNSEVKKGQLLAQIDPANFEAAVQEGQASINNANANLAKLRAEENLAAVTYKRYKNLYAKNFVAKSELDQAESSYKSIRAQINAQMAQISQAQAKLKTAKTNLGYTKIIAPVDGTIISRKIDLGQPVAASFQAPELFTIAQDLKKMQIEVSVSEADIGRVKEGQEVTYALDGYPDDEFTGTVSQVRLSPTTVSNVVTYSVIVDVENEDLKLKPGMTANVSIITDKSENVLCAPNSALKVSLDDTKKYEHQGIWKMENRKPQRIEIEVGASNDNVFEIKSDKIKKGDTIIIRQQRNTKNNANRGGGRGMGRPPMM